MGLIKCRNMVIPFNYVQSINNMLYLEGSPTQNIRVVWKLTFSFLNQGKRIHRDVFDKNGHMSPEFSKLLLLYIGLRNARLGFRQVEETHLMENVVYNELLSRGYAVDVGVVETRKRNSEGKQEKRKLEIDFVANLGSQRYYIQSAFQIPDQDKEKQEKESLNNVDDSFKKIVLVRDVVKISRDEKGIVTMSIYDFLMDKNSLEKC